jgi:hypothetical protein
MTSSEQTQAESPAPPQDDFYAHLSPEDRERALYNLDRYFEIVLGIFLRLEAEQRQKENIDAKDDCAIDNPSVRA